MNTFISVMTDHGYKLLLPVGNCMFWQDERRTNGNMIAKMVVECNGNRFSLNHTFDEIEEKLRNLNNSDRARSAAWIADNGV